jgi:putative addiction module killer protein
MTVFIAREGLEAWRGEDSGTGLRQVGSSASAIARAAARIQARIDRAESGNLGDCKPVGEGVAEMRIDYGPGYRVYFLQRGLEVVILLVGGGKATQAKDIELAKKFAKQV